MRKLGPIPPRLTDNEIRQAEKLLKYSAMQRRPPLSTDKDLLECLYYPLRTTNMSSFQYEMLVWETDKLKVFSEGIAPKIIPPKGCSLHHPIIQYKRLDEYTVIAIVANSHEGAIFTNEISQYSWELIGVVGIQGLAMLLLDGRHSLVHYSEIDVSFDARKEKIERENENKSLEEETPQQSDSSDGYWDQYDKGTPVNNIKVHEEIDEEASFSEYCEPSPELNAQKIRSSAVQALVDLGALYEDCGADTQTAVQDIVDIALNSVTVPKEVPPIAHRHALRTVAWVKDGSMAFKDEVLAAINIITRRASSSA